MVNNNDNSHVPDGDLPSDWQKTVNDHSTGTTPKRDTTSPGALNASGMPIPDMIIGKPMGSGTIAGYIGSGGMGDVYKIWNEHVNRFHAVKLLRHGSGVLAEKRFEREIKVTATFDHPNIVRVHGAGRWKGYSFLEMEYIEGQGLDVLLQKNKSVPPVVALAIGILVSSALHYAHNHSYTLNGEVYSGVIHRDLKPSNIMLANDGRLKLMDFGIAKPVGGELTMLTLGNLVGSLAYLPPEQLDNCGIDLRADIYTLGEVLYELVTGRPPFNAESQRKLIDNKVEGNYPSIDTAKYCIPLEFIKVIDKCMMVDPEERFQSAIDVGNALKAVYAKFTTQSPEAVLTAFVKGETIATTAIPATPQPRKQRSFRVPGAIAAASVIVLAITLLLITSHKHVPTAMPQTSSAAVVPEIVFPRLLDTIITDTLSIIWRRVSSAQEYRIQVASQSNFADSITFLSVKDTAGSVTGVPKPGTYAWRIGAVDAQSNVVWSGSGFWTVTAKIPGVPACLSPANNQKNVAATVTFAWNNVNHATAFRIQVAADREFKRPVFDSSRCSDTTITVTSFDASTTYYWHVCGKSDSFTGDWSPVCSFTTAQRATPGDTITEQDVGRVAAEALRSNNPSNAEAALLKLAANDPRRDTLIIRCAEAYFATGILSKSKRLLKNIVAIDQQADLLRGRILLAEKDAATAYKVLDMAMTSPTKFKSVHTHADIMYYRAIAASACWVTTPTGTTKANALSAWKEVRTYYKNDSTNPRYRQAAEEATKIAD